MSDQAAESVGKCKAGLSLNGLTSLSDEAAKGLSNLKGRYLYLRGLTILSDDAAKSLSKYKHELDYNQNIMPESAAKILLYAGHCDED